ncbi:MAG TPA: hypothetical protein VMU53_04875 [Candidatus Sulfotelmatobacter sp.]|nr:hypothetical protein [Candidatus Sulfotelmatobacter sp.]
MPQPVPPNRKSRIALLTLIAVLALCAFQYGDNLGLNGLPFAQVRPLVGDLSKAQRMAKQGNIDFFAGQAVAGKPLTLRGELTDANCFLTTQTHAYDHAFCAKLCAAAGSPLVFIPDQGGPPYLVLTPRKGVPVPEKLLDQIGVPGIVVQGKVLESGGIKALAILDLSR